MFTFDFSNENIIFRGKISKLSQKAMLIDLFSFDKGISPEMVILSFSRSVVHSDLM